MALAPEEIGARIAKARGAKGWTHEQFRDAVREATGDYGIGLRTVQRWQKGRDPKTGKSWLPRLPRLMELADLLDVPRSYFVEEEVPAEDDGWTVVVARLRALEEREGRNEEMLRELLRRVPAGPAAASEG